jgi:aminodeoxychorismate lyase
MNNLFYVNGSLIPADQPALLPTDRGFTLGDGLFETMRAVQGRVLRLQAHLERLAYGAGVLQIPLDVAGIPQAIAETLAANRLDQTDAMIRLTLSRGPAPRGLNYPLQPRPTLVIAAWPFAPYPDELYRRGMRAIILKQRRNEFAATASLKSLNYLEGIVGKNQAEAAGVNEGIFLNTQGFLAEACTSNLFFIKDGVLYTPSLDCGIIPGVIRRTILELARSNHLSVFEGKYKASSLLTSDEAFLTNSLMGIMPLTEVNQQKIGAGRPGKSIQKWRNMVIHTQ